TNSRPNRIADIVYLLQLLINANFTRGHWRHAEKRLSDRIATRPEQPRDAQDFSVMKVERNIEEFAFHIEIAGRKCHRVLLDPLRTGLHDRHLAASHGTAERCPAEIGCWPFGNHPAAAQYCDPIRKIKHFIELVTHKDNGHVLVA